jgi:hypothetical protein
MRELLVTAGLSNFVPAVLKEPLDHIPNRHFSQYIYRSPPSVSIDPARSETRKSGREYLRGRADF